MSNQPPAPPPPPGDTGGMPPPPSGGPSTAAAPVGIRIGARLIDAVILWLISLVIVVPIVVAAISSDASTSGFATALGGGGFGAAAIAASIVGVAINFAYFGLFDSSMGGTPGKKILSLRVIGPDGENPTFVESVKRNAWFALALVPTILGSLLELAAVIYILVTISQDDRNVGWHDTFAGGTRVLRN